MNQYVAKMKTAISNYHGKAKAAEAEIERAYSLYQREPAEREEQRIRDRLAKDRKTAEAEIDAACCDALDAVRAWGTLDGARMTDDVKLLDVGVTPQQFDALVDKYQDNYTMLNALHRYADNANREATRDAHGFPTTYYNTGKIPTPEAKSAAWEKVYNGALSMLSSLDRDGDAFTRSLAETGIDKWGENIDI